MTLTVHEQDYLEGLLSIINAVRQVYKKTHDLEDKLRLKKQYELLVREYTDTAQALLVRDFKPTDDDMKIIQEAAKDIRDAATAQAVLEAILRVLPRFIVI